MTQDLVSIIYRNLVKTQWEYLQYHLKGGKVGLMLFMALYSERTGDTKAVNLLERMLCGVSKGIMTRPCTLLKGNLGVAWALLLLCKKGIIETNRSLDTLLKYVFREFMVRYYSSPVMLIDDSLFSAGIYTLGQLPDNESQERYVVEERIIYIVDECERQLTRRMYNMYEPDNLSLSMLHSFLFFLQTCNMKKIFPYKAGKLIEFVKKKYDGIKEKTICDDFVYNVLLNSGQACIPQDMTDDEIFKFMGELGFYSLLYDRPQIFLTALNQICRRRYNVSKFVDENVSVETLCGWGYGLLLDEELWLKK